MTSNQAINVFVAIKDIQFILQLANIELKILFLLSVMLWFICLDTINIHKAVDMHL